MEDFRTPAGNRAPLERLVTLSWDLLGEIGPDGRLRSVPLDAWAAALGRSCEELGRLPVADLLLPDDRAVFAAALRLGGGLNAVQTRCLRPDGRRLTLAWRMGPGGDADSRCVAARDVTRLLELQDALVQAQTMGQVGRLALGVAHDFNNLLAVVVGCASQTPQDGGADRAAADDLRDAAGAAAELVEMLGACFRAGPGENAGDLNAAVSRSERLLRRLMGGVRLETRLTPDLAAVRTPPLRLLQILMNLAVNARDAMPGGGRLLIATEPAPASSRASRGWSRLTVTDEGVGMPPEVAARMFEPFYSTKPAGGGLGLSIVRDIVEESGGAVSAESRPGRGTTVRVDLPPVRA